MIKRWAAGEMAPWSLDLSAPSYPPQQCMHGEDAGGYQSSLTSRSASWNGKAHVQGETLPEKCIEENFPCRPLASTGSPVRAPLHTHSNSCVHTNDPNLTPTTCYMSTYHSVPFAH